MKLTNRLAIVAATVFAVASGAANAAIDYTPITGAFSASDVTTGVMAVAGTLALIYITIKGAKIVLGMVRGG